MPKGSRGKSSATPGTRKKHAAAAAAKRGESEPTLTLKTGKSSERKKLSKKERKQLAKKKAYVPPPKPPKPPPFPLDSMGLASLLPADLVVLLRKALKRDIVTRVRTMESLLAWIQGAPPQMDDGAPYELLSVEERCEALALMLPCWSHLFPRLALSPSQRVRLLTLQVHAALLEFPTPSPDSSCIRDELLSSTYLDSIIGFWAVLSYDTSRTVGRLGLQLWKRYVTWNEPNAQPTKLSLQEYVPLVLEHLRPILLTDAPVAALTQVTPSLQNTAPKEGTDMIAKTRSDTNLEENADEMNSRLVAGALGIMHAFMDMSQDLLPDLEGFLESTQMWTALLPVEWPGETDFHALGIGSPAARQRAWNVLSSLFRLDGAMLDRNKEVILPMVLHAAFAERDAAVILDMLAVCLPLLRKYPGAWTNDFDNDGHEDSDDEEQTSMTPYAQFVAWMQTIAPSAPVTCFPTILVFLSTMPADILPHTPESVSLMMEPLLSISDGLIQGMSDPQAWDAYMTMLCECLRYLVMRVIRQPSVSADQVQVTASLMTEELTYIFDHFILHSESKSLPPRLRLKSAREFGKCLPTLDVTVCETRLLAHTLEKVSSMLSTFDLEDDLAAVVELLVYVCSSTGVSDTLRGDVQRMIHATLERMLDAFQPTFLPHFASVLQSPAHDALASDTHVSERLTLIATDVIPSHLGNEGVSENDAVSFYTAYMQAMPALDEVWQALFRATLETPLSTLPMLVRVAQAAGHRLPGAQVLEEWRLSTLGQLESEPRAWLPLLDAPAWLQSRDIELRLIRALVQSAAHAELAEQAGLLQILGSWVAIDPSHAAQLYEDEEVKRHVVPLLWQVGYLHDQVATQAARHMWMQLTNQLADHSSALYTQATLFLQEELVGGSIPPRRILKASRALPAPYSDQVRLQPSHWEEAMQSVASSAASPFLVIHDPMVPIHSRVSTVSPSEFQRLARYADACMEMSEDTMSSIDVLPLLALTALVLEDALIAGDTKIWLQVYRSSKTTAVMDRGIAESFLVRLVHTVTRRLSMLASDLPASWHESAAQAMLNGSPSDALTTLMHSVWTHAMDSESVGFARLFARLLAGILSLSSASTTDAEMWVRTGMRMRPPHTPLACAILSATRTHAYDSPSHERWRNEIAANLSGVPPARANTDGVNGLQMLRCAAAPWSAGRALIPTQRAVFVLQGLQRWITSDDDLSETVFALLASVLTEFAPVVQSVPGRHLDLMLDVVEENMHAVDLDEDTGWPTLYLTLGLLNTLYDLRTHEHVRDTIEQHGHALQDALRDAFLGACIHASASRGTPNDVQDASMVLLTELVDMHVPSSRFASPEDQEVLTKLVCTPSTNRQLQVAALRMLGAATHERVREQVVEISLGSLSTSSAPELNASLVSSLKKAIALTPALWEEVEDDRSTVFSFLLQWLAVLDHFDEASLPVRTIFAGALQTDHLTHTQLLPSLFALIAGMPRAMGDIPAFDASRWAVDHVDLTQLPLTSPKGLQALAAHVYYRALVHLPTQVRDWWMSIRDRQLSIFVNHFTSKFCTPLLAERELSHLRDPTSLSRIQDEAMSIKVLSSNEVVATYTVDEHPMEIGVRLPPDYPLHGVEIRDIKRVGVSEAQWRAWLLAVQQLLSGKNGLILDALMLFKRNAEAKFQGYEGAECAICYSIISPTDQSLPNKPCRTCKHKFHGSCLYKWVSTSGASTCPLCRSIL